MKLMKYSWLAALPMIFTACQDDTLVENPQQDKMIYTLSAQVDKGAADSRAQIQLSNPLSGEEYFFWNTGDAFNVYQEQSANNYQKSLFTIADDYQEPSTGGQTSATFSTTRPVYSTYDYCAVYPANVDEGWNSFSFELHNWVNFNDKTPEEAWKEYFKRNMFMMATGNFADTENPSVSFRQMCAMVRVTYTNKTGQAQQVKQLYMDPSQEIGLAYRYEMNEKNGYFCGTGYNYWLELEGLTVEDGEATDLYMMIFPMAFNDSQLGLTICTEEGQKSNYINMSTIAAANPGDSTFVAGKRYWFKLTDTGEELMWTKDYREEDFIGTDTIYNKELSYALYDVLGSEKVTLVNDYAVMNRKDIRAITELDLGYEKYTISSLLGIEHFINLKFLKCENTGLKTCDLSQNRKLEMIYLSSNQLTSLDLTNNPLVHTLIASYNDSLEVVDLGACVVLDNLQIQGTALISLFIPNPQGMWNILLPSGLTMDLNQFTNLYGLGLDSRGLQNLDIIPAAIKSQLGYLKVDNNNLTEIDLSEFPALEAISCSENELTKLDFSSTPNVRDISCANNKITELDVTSLSKLEELYCVQEYGISLTVTMTSAQKELWDAKWSAYHENVTVKVDPNNNAGGGIVEAE